LLFRVSLIVLTLIPSIYVASQFFAAFNSPISLQRPFTDALTYLAAGDRLNLGHDLYRLRPGDMPVDLYPALFPVPMVGPPLMGVIFRPLAAIDIGLLIWVAACWTALVGAVAYLVDRVGLLAIVVCMAMCLPIGEQLAAANVASFFPALLIVSWNARASHVPGIAIGLMAGAKLAPIALAGWLLGSRNWPALVALAITLSTVAIACLVLAGPANVLDYQRVMATVDVSARSVSGVLGVSWASYAVLIGGTAISVGTARWPVVSFIAGIFAMTLGTPALYVSGMVALLGVLAPIADTPSLYRYRMLPGRNLA
jgi:hypothetical protein